MMVTGVVSSIVQSAAALASSVAMNAPRFIVSFEWQLTALYFGVEAHKLHMRGTGCSKKCRRCVGVSCAAF